MNTQIETLEEAAARFNPVIKRSSPFGNKYDWIPNRERKQFINGANWQKQQDESKYKELLDSHNELLKTLENSRSFMTAHIPEKIFDMVDKTINKAKNIKL